jgi:hypothetical protein
MQRRQLLQLMGLGSLSTLCPTAWPAILAGNANFDRLWLVVMASNGWDPVSFCNPYSSDFVMTDAKGVNTSRGKMSSYSPSFIKKLGGITYAPGITETADPAYGRFVEKYYQSLLVINGIDMGTNGHDEGKQKSTSGKQGGQYPAFAAYAAAAAVGDSGIPMPFLSYDNNGFDDSRVYNNTGNLISRVPLEGVQYVLELSNTRQQLGNKLVVSDAIAAQLEQTQLARLQQLQADSTLPRQQQELQAFYDAQLNRDQLKNLKAKLPTTYNSNGTLARVQDIFASMAAGLTVSAQLSIGGGFDTHSNHDVRQGAAINDFFNKMDFLLQEAERQGLRDRLNILMVSDFGRTPFYNTDNGKDHWSTGSMLLMGPDFTGNRMIQASDTLVRPQKINLETLLPDASGKTLTVEMVQRSLRNLTGINNEVEQKFPLSAQAVPALFTG